MVFKAVDEKVLLSLVNYRIRRAWYVLGRYIRAEREIRQSHFFSFFEHAAYRAAEISAMKLQRKLGLRSFPDQGDQANFPGDGSFEPAQSAHAAEPAG